MALERKQQTLLDRAQRIVGTRDILGAVAQVRAIIGPEQIPDSEELAQIALEKMRRGEVPTPEELAALAIVIRILRPVLLVRNATLPELPRDPDHDLHSAEYRALWDAFRLKVDPGVASIGRIEGQNGEHVGTGFLVSDTLVATNRHVVDVLTLGSGVLLPDRQARICFGREDGVLLKPGDIVEFIDVVDVHPQLDVALLRVAPQVRKPLVLAEEPLDQAKTVAVIGYPAKDNQNPGFLHPVFNNIFGVKRAALGELLDGGRSDAAYHDCSTTQGNSGSPVFSMDSGHVVAIHCAGSFMYRNEAVPYAAWRAFLQSHLT